MGGAAKGGAAILVLAAILFIISFATSFWLVADNTFFPFEQFQRMGLWQVCFSPVPFAFDGFGGAPHPPSGGGIGVYLDCLWVFGYYFNIELFFFDYSFFTAVQILYTLALILLLLALILLPATAAAKTFDRRAIVLASAGAFSLASGFFAAVALIVFGSLAIYRRLVPYPHRDYLSWSFGVGVGAAFLNLVAGVLLLTDVMVERRKRQRTEPVDEMDWRWSVWMSLALVCAFAATLFACIAFSTTYWLETDPFWTTERVSRLGLWQICFDFVDARRPFHDHDDCPQFADYRLQEYRPSFFVATQVLFCLCLILLVLGGLLSVSLAFKRSWRYPIVFVVMLLVLLSAIFGLLAVAVFGAMAKTFSWITDRDTVQLSWSYWLAVPAVILEFVVAVCLTLHLVIAVRDSSPAVSIGNDDDFLKGSKM